MKKQKHNTAVGRYQFGTQLSIDHNAERPLSAHHELCKINGSIRQNDPVKAVPAPRLRSESSCINKRLKLMVDFNQASRQPTRCTRLIWSMLGQLDQLAINRHDRNRFNSIPSRSTA